MTTPENSERGQPLAVPLSDGLGPLVDLLAGWEDAHGTMAAITPREWAELGPRVAEACVEQSPRMVRNELRRLKGRFGDAADKALTYAESYEMAVARLVLAMDYMHPEQRRAFNAAWAAKREELRAVSLRA